MGSHESCSLSPRGMLYGRVHQLPVLVAFPHQGCQVVCGHRHHLRSEQGVPLPSGGTSTTSPCSQSALDFVTGLPVSQGYDTILTVVDCFSKAVNFVPLAKLPSASETADLLTIHVVHLHRIPLDIVSEPGPGQCLVTHCFSSSTSTSPAGNSNQVSCSRSPSLPAHHKRRLRAHSQCLNIDLIWLPLLKTSVSQLHSSIQPPSLRFQDSSSIPL